MSGRVAGKVAVITGGASGLGRACAVRLAEEGAAAVVVADIHTEQAAEVGKEVEALGAAALVIETDTSSEDACETMAELAVEHFGRLDVCVAAAGISHALYVSGQERGEARAEREASFVVNKPTAYWQRVLDVNLNGVMYTDRAVARRMIGLGHGGSIINIASGAAKIAIPGSADYCVSKAGVWMLTKCLALELQSHDIRVNAIGPGFIETPMTASFRRNETMVAGVVHRTPVGRLGTPEDIANTALFLASEESSFFTGSILYPDGGLDAGSR